jgi:hypothetical protein
MGPFDMPAISTGPRMAQTTVRPYLKCGI